jgi:hypothetical protein
LTDPTGNLVLLGIGVTGTLDAALDRDHDQRGRRAFLGDWMLSHAHPYAPAVPAFVTAVVIAIASVPLKPRAMSVPIGGRSLPVRWAAK